MRQHLRRSGILYARDGAPIRHRNGSPAPWAFYSWNVTLTSHGLRLAAAAVLESLESFAGTQLAAHGFTALPIMSACVALGAGRYRGLAIREQRKTYLSCRQIEGPIDRRTPVVVIDDSISSGTSLRRAIAALESEGLEVEGTIALVNFPNRGGMEWAAASGYRAEALFDIWRDLEMLPPRHSYHVPSLPIGGERYAVPDGLVPAAVARWTAEHYLRHGWAPRPPRRLDRAYDAAGGVFVSFRRKRDDHRLAREGYWNLDDRAADVCSDVMLATLRTIDASAGGINLVNLDDLKIAVTFFGALERITPARLDFDRYGIVVRDADFGTKIGGALPNTQVFISEIQQYNHARFRNAQLGRTEAHELFRHTVAKYPEPGSDWLPYGRPDTTAWYEDDALGAALCARARGVALAAASEPLRADILATELAGVAVTLYHAGTIGTAVSWGPRDLDALVCDAAARAARDRRVVDLQRRNPEAPIAVVVSLLHDPEHLHGTRMAVVKIRRGLDSVRVTQGERSAMLLPSAVVYNNWSKPMLVQQLLRFAGITRRPPSFTTYRTTAWVADESGVRRLRFGFPVRPNETAPFDARTAIATLATFLMNNLSAEGVPAYVVDSISGATYHSGTAPRLLHGLVALDRAAALLGVPEWRAAALRGLTRYLEGSDGEAVGFSAATGGSLADAVLVARVGTDDHPLRRHDAVAAAVQRLRALLQPDGRIAPTSVPRRHHDHEYLPGAVLMALAAVDTGVSAATAAQLRRSLDWYRNRFRALPSWGMAGWQTQGWSAMHRHTDDPEQAAFVFELADWALERQLEKSGAFLEDLSPEEPSFNTGFIAEGIAASWAVAVRVGDTARATRYERSWAAASRFMKTLLIEPGDTFCFASPARAIGGVRLTQTRCDVRVDAVSHWMHALIAGAELRGSAASAARTMNEGRSVR